MKKILIVFVLCFLISAVNSKVHSQIAPPSRMEIFMIVAPDDTTNLYGDSTFHVNTRLKAKMFVQLADSVNISKLHVKLGNTDGGSQYAAKEFLYDVTGNFVDGTSYVRNGNTVYLGLGTFTGIADYFAEIKLEDTSGNFSSIVKYHN